MLDIKFIRGNVDLIKQTCQQKHCTGVGIDKLLEIDDERRKLIKESEDIKAEKNKASEKIAQMQGDDKQVAIAEMKLVSEKEKEIDEKLQKIKEEFESLMLRVPMPYAPDTPEGKDESENVEIYTKGEIPTFDFELKDHMELMKLHDMVDIERGVKLSGARSYFLKNDGVLLEQAVLQYTFKKLVEKGFTPMSVPYMVDTDCLRGTGYFPGGEEDAYNMERDDKWLIATAEIPLTAYHKDEILTEEELPKTYAGMSTCFRREAGTYGKDTHGLYRIHQFNKVEQVIILPADTEKSDEWHEQILANAEEILKDLRLPYRKLHLCSGDLALGKYKSHDLECWMPSRDSYGETHSATSFKDFQARRLNLRYKDSNGKTKFCYTLNNTAIATPRLLISLLECNQNKDGSINIPEVLQEYMGKDKIG
ncbi:serine--tRNA ligase [Candidatus Peregrinibacteria bacterium]|jgi:seryl-tRNA synthetase|nr:serine--tRNA ligase [Candidatus Peregrinibacteria bacterium]